MKVTVVFLLMVVVVAAVHAEKLEWQGAQVLTSISGEVPIIEDKLSLQSYMSYFRIPSDGTEQFYYYAGPGLVVKKWNEKDSFWLSPRVGLAGSRTENGSDAVIVSLWTGVSLFEGQLALFLEGEGYLNLSQQIYYGYYAMDYNPTDSLNIGLHSEQIDKEASFGPHIGITHGPWHTELRYFAGFQEDNRGQSVRFVTALSF